MLSTKIGVLGGGQLGLMLLQASIDWNLDISVLDADPNAPCSTLAPHFQQGSIQDYDTVYAFGKDLDVITVEIEKVNIDALERLEQEGKRVYPQPSVLRIIQDKRTQKQFYEQHDLPTAPFVLTENKDDVRNHLSMLPAFHKLGRDGYDGQGVRKIASEQEVDQAFDAPGVLEQAIPFEKELAVIVARNSKGELETFPVVEMAFHPVKHLVEFLFAPARIAPEIERKATELAVRVAESFGVVGLLAVEMFLTPDGQVLINEVAPRPHNSGHHTIRANVTSQYEQHWRAILDLPLGNTEAYSPSAMINLLGEEGFEGPAKYDGMESLLAEKGVFPFLYGKKITKPFRKMGHVTITDSDIDSLMAKARAVKDQIRVIS
jgi:5-(carboxyamino)imidazole ribonucleotide synthase